jgi:hypothetical protein
MKVYLSKPTRKFKKYSILVGHKKINFGDDRYEDYTQHGDPKRKALYIQRHKKNEDWNNPLTAGWWSRYLLWEKPSIEEAIKDIKKRFGIIVIHSLQA